MDDIVCDRLTRGIERDVSRRELGGIALGTVLSPGLAAGAGAKK